MQQEKDRADTTTPPPHYSHSPLLTPPPSGQKPSASVLRALQAIERYKKGYYSEEKSWLGIRIDANDFKDLERRLSEDEYYLNKLQCGYFPLQNLFVIRMHTPIHERFLVLIQNEIELQLRRLAEGPSSKFAKDIGFYASTTFKPTDPDYGTHDPDGSFGHVEEMFPGMILEVAYSQQGKMLRDLADDYILGSDLRVRVLVGFDLPYKKMQATFSVWKPQMQREANENVWTVESKTQIFRRDNGEANLDSGAGLLLHLRDFASVEFCEKFENLDETIFISCNTLCGYLSEAEKVMDVRSAPALPRPVLKKRRRARTPEENLATADEQVIVDSEERAAKRLEQDDSSYGDSSSIQSESS